MIILTKRAGVFMHRLSNLRLRTKVIINAIALIVATSFLAFVSLIGIYTVQNAAKVSATYYSSIVENAITINNDFIVSTNDYQTYLKEPNDKNIANFQEQLNAIHRYFNALKASVDNDSRAEMIAVSIPDFENELNSYGDSSIALLQHQQVILKNQAEINKRITVFLNAATDFLNSIYNNILTAEDPEVERRIPRVQEMVAVIDGMKDAVYEVNKGIYSADAAARKQTVNKIKTIKDTVERLYNQTKVAETKRLAKIALDETESILKLATKIFRGLDKGSTITETQKNAETNVRNYINGVNTMASVLIKDSSNEIVSIAQRTFILIFISMAVGSLVALSIVLFMIVDIIRPLNRFIELIKNLTEGDGDLTKTVNVTTKDEFGILAGYINSFIKSVRNVMKEVQGVSHEVTSASNELASVAEELQSTFQSQTEQITDISHNMINLSGLSESVSSSLSQSSEKLQNTTSLTQAGAVSLVSIKNEMKVISENTSKLAQTISTLSESSEDIGRILTVINDIADQTNLLALNAAIEAARAGEAGRGFAVVADEVRKLAERTSSATHEISTIIQSFQQESDSAAKNMNTTSKSIDDGSNKVDKTLEDFKHVVDGISEANNDIVNITHMVEEQNNSIQDVTNNTGSISAGISQSNVAIGEVTKTIDHLQVKTTNLEHILSQFKVD